MQLGATQPATTGATLHQPRNPTFCRRAWSSTRTVLAAGLVTACGSGVSAHTLYVVTSSESYAGTNDDGTIEFTFCRSENLYCDPTESIDTPEDNGFDEVAGTVSLTVSLGYTPTTMKIANPGSEAWGFNSVMWNDEEGSNLLGSNSTIYLDQQVGIAGGCLGGGLHPSLDAICSPSWVFFNLDGSSNEYKVGVDACEGTSSASVNAYFCSNVICNGTIGDEMEVELTMSDEEGGWTYTTFSADFNPVAMRLVEVEDQDVTWCAETVSYNFFTVIDYEISTDDFEIDESGEASIIVQNIQHNGYLTPAPTSAPISESPEAPISADDDDSSSESRWHDATWEIVVTVVAALVVAGGSMLCKWWLSRRNSSSS